VVVRGSSVAWVVIVSFNNRMVSFNCDNIGFGLVWYVQSSNLVSSHPRVVVFGGPSIIITDLAQLVGSPARIILLVGLYGFSS